MPGDKEKLSARGEKIQEATRLPDALALLVQDYAGLDPTQALINKSLCELNNEENYDWDGFSLNAALAEMRGRSRGTGYPVLLKAYKFENAIFGEQKQSESKWNVTLPAKTMWDQGGLKEHIYKEMASWRHGKLLKTEIYFSGGSLNGAQFKGLMCGGLRFEGTLQGASFRCSLLTGAIFWGANMAGADLSFSYGAKWIVRNDIMLPAVGVLAFAVTSNSDIVARFDNVQLTRANLYRSNFYSGIFVNTDFNYANLSESNFSFAHFSRCSMQLAHLSMSDFSSSSLSLCDLFGVNATRADFRNANLQGVNFEGAILTEANLMGASFRDANMSGARLNEAHFLLSQFTAEQVLSFYYADPDAARYIEAINEYKQEMPEKGRKKELERANMLIMDFINQVEPGENKLLAGFLLTGSLRGEYTFGGLFGTSDKANPNSLCARLLAVRKQIEQEKSAGQEQKAVPTLAHN